MGQVSLKDATDSAVTASIVLNGSSILFKSIVVQALQRGVRIPADAGLVAFGTNDWEAYKFVPRLTAVERNYAGIIEAGVAMFCELMDKDTVRVPQVTVPERFSIRGQHRKPARMTAGTSTSPKRNKK